MRRVVAVVVLAVLATAACGDGSPPPSAEPQVDRLGPVTVQRTGGIAGVQEEVTVQPDGSWGRAGAGPATTGRLPADRNATLTRMAADPALRDEATRSPAPDQCADAFEYTLRVADVRVTWTDCGATPPPVASRIARFLLDGTHSK
jgi:hypothetical protein